MEAGHGESETDQLISPIVRAWRLVGAVCALTLLLIPSAANALSRDEGRQIANDHPDWLLPRWTSGGPAAWTMVGAPYGAAVTLVGADGSFAPRNHGPGVSVWLYDVDSAGRMLMTGEQQWRYRLNDDGTR